MTAAATTRRHLVSSRPILATCRTCAAPVLTGYAEGVPVVVDPTPISRQAELRTVVGGRSCYALIGGELVFRDVHRLTRPAVLILPAHRCGEMTDDELRTAWPTPKPTVAVTADAPPF